MADTRVVDLVKEDSSDDDLPPVISMNEINVDELQVKNVLSVCPHVDAQDIEKDLKLSGSATATINRIFDGQFLSGTEVQSCSMAQMFRNTEGSSHSMTCSTSSPILTPDDVKSADSELKTSNTHVQELSDTDLDTDTDDDDIVMIKNEREKMFTSLKDRIFRNKVSNEVIKEIDLTSDYIPSDNKLVDNKVNVKEFTSLCISDSDSEDDLGPAFYNKEQDTCKNKNIENKNRNSDCLLSNTEEYKDKPNVISNCYGSSKNVQYPEGSGQDKCLSSNLEFESDDESLPLSSATVPLVSTQITYHPKRSYSTSQKTDNLSDIEPAAKIQGIIAEGQPKKKRTRKSPEESLKDKEQAQARKAAKEKEKEAKKLEREEKKKAALEKKIAKEKEKLLKKADSLTNKSQKRDECLKHIVAIIDPGLFEEVQELDGINYILMRLQSLGAHYRVEPQATPACVIWQRADVKHTVNSEMQIAVEKMYSDEDQILIRLKQPNFIEMLNAFCIGKQGAYMGEPSETLLSFTKRVKQLHRNKQITFLVMGMERYFRNQKTNQQRRFRDIALGSTSLDVEIGSDKTKQKKPKKKTNVTAVISRLDMEEALVDLQLRTGCTVRICETEEQLAELIAMFTKAIAEAPFKRKQQPQGLAFCVEGGDKPSVKVSKDGQGLLKVWQRQIEQLRNVSAEMAAAIVAEYSSPQCLLQAYKRCSSKTEASKLLEDILVRRGAGILATTRRIGPDLSRRVHLLLTSEDDKASMQR